MTVKDFVESLAAEIGGNALRAETSIDIPTPQENPTSHEKSDARLSVIGSDGLHVGTVDHVQGDWIVLQETLGSAPSRLATKFVVATETDKLKLSITSPEAKNQIETSVLTQTNEGSGNS